MFNVEDYVIHRTTRSIGKVMGHGHQIANGAYFPTLKVRIIKGVGVAPGTFLEDRYAAWEEAKIEAVEEVQLTVER
jgi:hypothetical protein